MTVVRATHLGATVLEHTRTALSTIDLLFITDPDGTRIELLQRKPAAG
jgi:hypothetical protein